jgi:hypothetical protein
MVPKFGPTISFFLNPSIGVRVTLPRAVPRIEAASMRTAPNVKGEPGAVNPAVIGERAH